MSFCRALRLPVKRLYHCQLNLNRPSFTSDSTLYRPASAQKSGVTKQLSIKLDWFQRRGISKSVFLNMAKSRFEYVKQFELDDRCLPNCWIVVRVDGRGFHKFAEMHDFSKPNDIRALNLMSRAATMVMEEFRDICIAYGQSDEYSFVFKKDTILYNRRSAKLMTYVNSLFTSAYIYNWALYFGEVQLRYPPSFDARLVLYPTDKNLRDYLSWRQADVHVNNLYNTAFWNLVIKKGLKNQQAEERLRGTLSSEKNEILFDEFGINYNNEPVSFRKGTILIRKLYKSPPDVKLRQVVLPFFTDMIGESFWKENPEILGMKSLQVYNKPEELPVVSSNGESNTGPIPTEKRNIDPAQEPQHKSQTPSTTESSAKK